MDHNATPQEQAPQGLNDLQPQTTKVFPMVLPLSELLKVPESLEFILLGLDQYLSMCPLSVCVFFLLCAAALLLKFTMRSFGSSSSSLCFPCLPRLPVLGSLLHLPSSLPLHLGLTELSRRLGPVFGMFLGPHLNLVVSEVGLVREVLLQKGREFAGRPQMVTTDLLTRGGKDIAFADYSELWRSHRRLVHASFSLFGEGSSKLQSIVQDAADILCEELLHLQGQSSDLSVSITRAVTNVICMLVFSSSYEPEDPELARVMEYNQGIVETIAQGALVDIFPWLQIFPNKVLRKLKKCVTIRDQLLQRKLQEHKVSMTPGEPRDLLDALLMGQTGGSGNDNITEDHVIMTAAEAFGAGVETTSTTLMWLIAFLIHHPQLHHWDPSKALLAFVQVQERVHSELDECLGQDRSPSLSDRSHLPFLDAVLCEVMRIRPVSPILIPHVAMQDTSLGGAVVPKGTRVLVNMWAIHHDPKNWDEPHLFRPGERDG
ncbi:hypothetical protein DNTS_024681 [Danionella cerebrum]|uniref:Cytochrome P450 family 17 polypeptide 2 n=1 Tax=Danionella cerebrum TaxID=2873325 RepID=A0A553MKB9_9TELE|nr:hypothetical protein DNTS_024681 [Danionella translucida]